MVFGATPWVLDTFSSASSQWHLGMWSTSIPIEHPIVWSKDSSCSKSMQFASRCFRLVSGWSTTNASFFPSMVYCWSQFSSMKPCSHKTWIIPYGLPSHPSITFGILLVIGIPLFWQVCEVEQCFLWLLFLSLAVSWSGQFLWYFSFPSITLSFLVCSLFVSLIQKGPWLVDSKFIACVSPGFSIHSYLPR